MKVLFISLGCDKNLVDSEEMLGLLRSRGYEMTDDETEADVIVINTCCFIHDAKEESIQSILEMAEYRKEGSCKALLVTGCMAQRYQAEIRQEIPEVDAVVGIGANQMRFWELHPMERLWKLWNRFWRAGPMRGMTVSMNFLSFPPREYLPPAVIPGI